MESTLFLLLALFAAFDIVSSANTMTLYTFTAAEVQQYSARCLDGSASGFYYMAASTTANQDKWLINLEGGSYCLPTTGGYTDIETCTSRSTTALGSSKKWATTMANSDVPSIFSTFNQIYIPYCGGDQHSGTQTAAVDGLYYSGHNTVNAILQKGISVHNLGAATDVISMGISAGGSGMFVNADFIQSTLPQANHRLLSNAGWFIAVTPYSSSFMPREMSDSIIYTTTAGYVNKACAAAYPATPHYCYRGNITYPFLNTSLFIAESNYDTHQVFTYGGADTSTTDVASNTWIVNYFGPSMRKTLAQVISNPTTGIYLTSTETHEIPPTDAISGGTDKGVTFSATLGNWYAGTGNFKVQDTCVTPSCSTLKYTAAAPGSGSNAENGASGGDDFTPSTSAASICAIEIMVLAISILLMF